MPCRDYESDWGRAPCDCSYEKRRLDERTAQLCEALTIMESRGLTGHLKSSTQSWWKRHQEQDKRRKELERERREEERKRNYRDAKARLEALPEFERNALIKSFKTS